MWSGGATEEEEDRRGGGGGRGGGCREQLIGQGKYTQKHVIGQAGQVTSIDQSDNTMTARYKYHRTVAAVLSWVISSIPSKTIPAKAPVVLFLNLKTSNSKDPTFP